jgi:hypothetical protein
MELTTVPENSEIPSTDEANVNETEVTQSEEKEQTADNQAKKPRPIAKVVSGPTTTKRIEFQWLELKQIEGLDKVNDPRVEQVRAISSVSLRQLPIDCLTETGLKSLSCYLPVHVVRKKKSEIYSCVGGLRLFRLLKKRLAPADKVMAFIHRGNDEEIKLLATIDLLILPALLGPHLKDHRPLAAAWDKAEELGFEGMITRRQHHALNHMLGCDIRAKKKPR